MRITVGGVLLCGGVAFVAVSSLKLGNMDGIGHPFSWVTNYFKDEPTETAPVTVDTSTFTKTTAPLTDPSTLQPPATTDKPSTENAPAPAAVPAAPEKVAAASEVVAPAPVVSPKKSRRHHKPKTPKLASDTTTSLSLTRRPLKSDVQKRALAKKKDPLIGTYVSVKLKSGREVKGIYQGKSDKEYTIELPGMGPFKYEAANVVSVTPAE